MSTIVLGESAGIGSDGQFSPIKLSCEGSFEGSILSSFFLEVEPSMTAVGLAARRVKLRPTPVASVCVGGVLLFKKVKIIKLDNSTTRRNKYKKIRTRRYPLKN